MKKMVTIWLFIAVILFGTIFFIGINFNKEYKAYHDYEADMQEAASVYLTISNTKLNNNQKMVINLDELIKAKTMETNLVNEDACDGYVEVVNKGLQYEYKSFLKCSNYQTAK